MRVAGDRGVIRPLGLLPLPLVFQAGAADSATISLPFRTSLISSQASCSPQSRLTSDHSLHSGVLTLMLAPADQSTRSGLTFAAPPSGSQGLKQQPFGSRQERANVAHYGAGRVRPWSDAGISGHPGHSPPGAGFPGKIQAQGDLSRQFLSYLEQEQSFVPAVVVDTSLRLQATERRRSDKLTRTIRRSRTADC